MFYLSQSFFENPLYAQPTETLLRKPESCIEIQRGYCLSPGTGCQNLLKQEQTLVPVSWAGGLVVQTHTSYTCCFSLRGNQSSGKTWCPKVESDVVKASHHDSSSLRPRKRKLGYHTVSYNTISYIIPQ